MWQQRSVGKLVAKANKNRELLEKNQEMLIVNEAS
jgi:hypothetical protein